MAQSPKYAKLLEILKFLKTEKTRSNLLILQFQLSLATTTKDIRNDDQSSRILYLLKKKNIYYAFALFSDILKCLLQSIQTVF